MTNATTSAFITKLTDAQLVLLSAAFQRNDGLVVLTDAHPTFAALLRKEFVAELIVWRREPHWRQDENGHPAGLKLTIGAVNDRKGEDTERIVPQPGYVRARTKQAAVIALLPRPGGANPRRLDRRTGWLPHTTRAALSGLRKKGFELSSEKRAGGERRYSITVPGQASAA